MRRAIVFIGLACVLASASAGADQITQPPVAVTVLKDHAGAVVTWIPTGSVASGSYYKVYGFVGDTPHYVGSTESTSYETDGAFQSYGVSSVIGGVESSIASACLHFDFGFLPPLIIRDCTGEKSPGRLTPAIVKP